MCLLFEVMSVYILCGFWNPPASLPGGAVADIWGEGGAAGEGASSGQVIAVSSPTVPWQAGGRQLSTWIQQHSATFGFWILESGEALFLWYAEPQHARL